MRKLLGLLLAGTVFAAVPQAMAQEKLTLWFNRGFYPAEDEALNKVIAGFEKQTGVEIELTLFGVEDIITKAVSAVEATTQPEGAYGWTYEFLNAGNWASEGKLADGSALLPHIKEKSLAGVVPSGNR